MPATYAVLFKVYYIDDFVIRRVRQLSRQVRNGHLYVVGDETQGTLQIDHDRVVRLRESDVLDLGLVGGCDGYSVIWYDADYVLYYCAANLPPYDYYITMDYDAVANCDLDTFVAWAAAQGADLVDRPIEEDVATWAWRHTCEQVYEPLEDVRPVLNCVALYSAAATQHLFARRRALSERYRAGEITQWPISEGFIATELALGGFTVLDIRDFGDMPDLIWWPPLHESELPRVADQPFVHPVLTGRRYVQSLLRFEPAISVFQADSRLADRLRVSQPRDYIPLVLPNLPAELADPPAAGSLAGVLALLTEHAGGLPNVALAKRATQSSVCEWSQGADVHLDAAGAVNGQLTGGAGFHTDEEAGPWWMVDLQGRHTLAELRLFNRLEFPERAATLRALVSEDGETWREVMATPADPEFGGADGNPLSVTLEAGVIARFVRLQLAEPGSLHLDQVMVFGEPLALPEPEPAEEQDEDDEQAEDDAGN